MDGGEQKREKFSLTGFAQNKSIGAEYCLHLGVSSELSRCKPETSRGLPDDGAAFPALQSGTLQLQNALRTAQVLQRL